MNQNISYLKYSSFSGKIKRIFSSKIGLKVIFVALFFFAVAYAQTSNASAPTVSSVNPAAGPPAGGTNVTITGTNFSAGGIDSYTKLSLHADGTNNSTAFADSETTPKTVTANGDAKILTNQSKFGGASGYFDGTGDFLTVPTSADFNFGSGDFTVDWWEYRTSSTAGKPAIARDTTSSYQSFLFGYASGANLLIYMSSGGAWDVSVGRTLGAITLNQWVHLAVVRSGNTFYAFKNGVQTDTWTSSLSLAANANPLSIGRYNNNKDFQGYIDEVRISKGIARWTANFTPSTSPYSTGSVTFGGTAAANVQVADSANITVVTPAHSAGAVDVSVIGSDGLTGTLTNGFTYSNPPTVTSVTPSSVIKTGGSSVTITGSNFTDTPTVTFGGTAGTSVNLIDANTISVVTPAHTSGILDIVVTNPDGQSGALTSGIIFTEPPPTISAITPNIGSTAGGTNVTITGTNFAAASLATGGTVTTSGVYTIHTFTANGTFTVPNARNVEVLVIGGGGGGGEAIGGGGGAGGVIYNPAFAVTAQAYSVTVGTGGNGGLGGSTSPGVSGSNSTFSSLVAIGGGGGSGQLGGAPLIGGSGGGASAQIGLQGAAGTSGQGNAGGYGTQLGGNYGAGGGGGAGSVGVNGISTTGGAGGVGVSYPQFASVGGDINYPGGGWFAGGGGGGTYLNGSIGVGGKGGGGNSGAGGMNNPGNPGQANTGGGGGAGNYQTAYSAGGKGGSGIVIVRYLTPSPTVTFGGITATNTQFINSTTITTVIPAHTTGAVDVIVTNPDSSTGTLTNGFAYNNPPTVTSVTPSSVIKTGGSSVTITGTNFSETPSVTFGETAGTSVNRIDANTISVVTPTHSAGTFDVVVTNSDGVSGTLTNGIIFTEPPPTITSVSPSAGPPDGGTPVTITGTGFSSGIIADTYDKLLLHADGTNNSTTFVDSETIPKSATPNGNAKILTAQSKFGGSSAYFDGAGDWLSVGASTDFNFGSGSFTIDYWFYRTQSNVQETFLNSWQNYNATNNWATYVTSANKLGWFPQGYQSGAAPNLTGTTSITQNAWHHAAFTYDGSICRMFLDGNLEASQSIVAGSNSDQALIFGINSADFTSQPFLGYFDDLRVSKGIARWTSSFVPMASNLVSFGGTLATNVQVVSPTTLTATTPVHSAGAVNVVITNPDGTVGSRANGFTYNNPPAVSSITPGSVPKTGGNSVTISGTNFVGTPTVTFGGTAGTSVNGIDANTINVVTPAHLTGAFDVVVTNPDGLSGTLTSGIVFTEPPPTILSVVPSVGPPGGGTDVTIIGTNFFTENFTKLLLHADGTNNSTAFADSETVAKTVIANGGAKISTVQSKIGGASAYFDGTGDYLTVPTNNDFNFGAGDFTVDWWEYRTASDSTRSSIARDSTSGYAPFLLGYSAGGNLLIYMSSGGAWDVAVGKSLGAITLNQWVHLAVVRSENNFYAFKNGTQTDSWTSSASLGSNSNPLSIGRYAGNDFQGYLDEIRISKGIARWTSNFAPQTNPYTATFLPATFGGTPAANVQLIDSTTITATTPAHSAGFVDVTITNPDDTSATLTRGFAYYPDKYAFSSFPATLRETEIGNFTVQARDTDGNVLVAPEDIALDLSSSSTSGFFARSLTEDVSNRWNYNSVVLPAGQSSVTFYYKDNIKGTPTIEARATAIPGSTAASQQISVTSRYRLLVTGITNPVKAGIPSSVTVQAVDFDGQPLHDYVGLVHFTSTDIGAVLPPDFTFTAGMLGEHTFVNGVAFTTVGSWNVVVTDTTDANITGTQTGIVVTTPNAGTISKLKIISSPQSFGIDSHSSAITIQAQDIIGQGIPASVDTSIYVYVDSVTGQFSIDGESNWSGTEPFIVTIKQNSTTASFYYKDSALGPHGLTVREDVGEGIDVGWLNDTQTETTLTGGAAKLTLNVASQNVSAGNISDPITASLEDIYGNIVTTLSNERIYLTTNSPTGKFSAYNNVDDWVNSFSVIIPAGQSSVTIYYKNQVAGVDNIILSDAYPANGAAGLTDDNKDLTISGGAVAKYVFATAAFESVLGAASPQISIQAQDQYNNPAQVVEDTIVYLYATSGGIFSSSSSFLTTISSVIIPNSQSTANFYFKQSNYAASASITASDNNTSPDGGVGISDAAQNESLVPGSISKLMLNVDNTNLVAGASSAVITVKSYNSNDVNIPAPTDLTVNLSTSASETGKFDTSNAGAYDGSVTSVTIPAGQLSADFYYKDTKVGSPVVTAASGGITAATKTFDILGGDANKIVIISSAQTLEVGQKSAAINIETQDQYGNSRKLASDTSIYLYASSLSGTFFDSIGNVVTEIVISSGTSNSTLYYKDVTIGTPQITVSDYSYPDSPDQGLLNATQIANINYGNVTKLALDISDSNLVAGTSSGVVNVKVYNSSNINIPTSSDLTASLSSSTAGKFDISSSGVFDGSITSVTILQNQSAAIIYYKDNVAGSPVLTVSAAGKTAGTLALSVAAGAASRLAIASAPQTLSAGQKSAAVNIRTQDGYNNMQNVVADKTIHLHSSSATGIFLDATGDTITQVVILAGTSSATVYCKDDVAGSPVLTFSDYAYPDSPDQGLENVTQTETINWGAITKLTLEAADVSLSAGVVSPLVTVKSYNVNNINVPVSSDLVVNLSSASSTGRFDTNSSGVFDGSINSATILQDQSSVSFYYKDTAIGSPLVTAASAGKTSGTLAFNVAAGALNKLSMNTEAQTLELGQKSAVMVIETQDAFGNIQNVSADTTLYLHSSSATGVFLDAADQVISTVAINSGSNNAEFYYKDTAIGNPQITISDFAYPDSPDQGLLNATQNESIIYGVVKKFALSCASNVLTAGSPSGALSLTALNNYDQLVPVTADTTVNLSSISGGGKFDTENNGLFETNQVVIASGQSSTTFYYKDTASGSPTITAAKNGIVSGTYSFNISASSAYQMIFANNPFSVSAGNPTSAFILQFRDQYGNVKLLDNSLVINLASTEALSGGFAAFSEGPWNIASVNANPGVSAVNFYYRDTLAGTKNISVTASGIVGANQDITVAGGSAHHLTFTSNSQTILALDSGQLTVQLRDQYDNPTGAVGNVTLGLSSDSTHAQFSSAPSPWSSVSSYVLANGQSTATFYYKDWNVGTPTITVTSGGIIETSQQETINAGVAAKFFFQSAPQTIVLNTPSSSVSFYLTDSNDIRVNASADMTANIVSNSLTGEFSLDGLSDWTNDLDISLLVGESLKSFYYRDAIVNSPIITISASEFTSNSQQENLINGSIEKIIMSSVNASQVGNAIAVTIQTQTNSSLPVSVNSDTIFDLTKSGSTGQFSLSSSPWNSITQVTIPAKQYTKTVYFKDTTAGTVMLTVDENISEGWIAGTKEITFGAGAVQKLNLIAKPTSVAVGTASNVFTVQAQDQYGNAVLVDSDKTVYLYSPVQGSFATNSSGPWNLSTVTILAGTSTASFYYQDQMPGTKNVTVSDYALLDNPDLDIINAVASIDVIGDTPNKLKITSGEQAISAGSYSTVITIELEKSDGSPAIIGVPVSINLTSSPLGLSAFKIAAQENAEAINQVIVPIGSSVATVYYTNRIAGTYSLGANANNVIGDAQQLTVTAGSPAKVVFMNAPQTKMAGLISDQMRIQLRDSYNNVSNAVSDLAISLATTSTAGKFSLQNGGAWADIASLTLPSGSNDAFFYYKDTSTGTFALTADEFPNSGLVAATQNYVVSAGDLASMVFLSSGQTLVAGQASSVMSLGFRDEFGNAKILAQPIELYLYSSSSEGSFSQNSGFSGTITSISVVAGSGGTIFYYKDTKSGMPTVTASDQSTLDNPIDLGVVNAAQVQMIAPGSPARMQLVNGNSSLIAGNYKTFDLRIQNQYGVEVAPDSPLEIYLSSSDGSGKFSLSQTFNSGDLINHFSLSAGSSQKTLYYRNTISGNVTVSFSEVSTPPESPDSGIVNTSQSFSVLPSAVSNLVYLTSAQDLSAGEVSSEITFGVRDAFGNIVVSASDLPVYLNSTSGTGKFSASTNFSDGNIISQSIISAGSSVANFYYQDETIGGPVITVSDQTPLDNPDVGLLNAVQTFSVRAGNVAKLIFDQNLGAVIAGGISDPITIKTQNTFSVDAPVLGDAIVYLFSSSAGGSFALLPSGPWGITSVVIPGGQNSIQVYYRDSNSGTPLVTASDTDVSAPDTLWTNATGTVSVGAGVITQLVFVTAPQTIVTRHPSEPMQVQARNAYGNPTSVTTDQRIYLRSSSNQSEFLASVGGSWGASYVTMLAGQDATNFYYHDFSVGEPTLTASDNLPPIPDTGLTNAVQTEVIAAQVMDHFLVTNISDPQIQGEPSSVVVMAQDAEDYVISSYSGTIHFASSDLDAALPLDYTFIPATDSGLHTFGNGVSFLHAGEKWVGVTDGASISGVQEDITVISNTAGPVNKIKFTDTDSPLVVNKNIASKPMTIRMFDADDRNTNAGLGGYPIRLSSGSNSAKYSLNPNGPWIEDGLFSIPENLSFIVVYYKDSEAGAEVISVSDWDGGVDDLNIANDSLPVIVRSIKINVNTHLEINNNGHYYQDSPVIFSKDDTGYYYGRVNFDLSLIDEVTGAAKLVDVSITWKDPSGAVLATQAVLNVSSYSYNINPIEGIALSAGNYTLEVSAIDVATGVTGESIIDIPVSGWVDNVDYSADTLTIGNNLNFTVETKQNGVFADPENLVVVWKDNNGNDVPGDQYIKNLSGLTKIGTGKYSGSIITNGLVADKKYFLYTKVYDASNNTLAEDNHRDIVMQNNPALAPKNFQIEKILTSVPPAAETYNLEFNWDVSLGATKYNLYRTQNKFSGLFEDPCSISQIKFGHRYGDPGATTPFCELSGLMQDGADDATSWVKMAEIDGLQVEYTVPWAEIQSDLSNNVYYYILRAENSIGESGYSTMAVSLKKNFNTNTTKANINWTSLPYATKYQKASDIIADMEGGIGNGNNAKVSSITRWRPDTQNILSYYYDTFTHHWMGTDFTVNPGDGISVQLSKNIANFNWTIAGSDVQNAKTFTTNITKANINWTSLPYTTKYQKASDMVRDMEGGIGDGNNAKISSITRWRPDTQNILSYYYDTFTHQWMGTDFSVNPGDGVSIQLSKNTTSFDWSQPLVINPYK
ncbi:MAG: IPT/TIG domain-containing protein [Candidatus Moraniibacteriota bacterium]